jgi:Site-specific recombinase XerD
VERTLPYLTPMVRDIVQVQLCAGMRAAEVCRMRFDELSRDDDGTLWYRPVKHKNASRGKERNIPLGPKAQKILATYGVTMDVVTSAGAAPREYVFDPRNIELRSSEFCRPKRTPNAIPYFTTDRYAEEIRNGAGRAVAAGAITESERWTSHQLRHRALTDMRREYGLDVAQLLGGHSDAKTTERYAAPDRSKAVRCVMETG